MKGIQVVSRVSFRQLAIDLSKDDETRLLFGFVCLNIVVLLFEIVFGLSTGSLGLVCDGVHMAVSCSGLGLSLVAMKLTQQKPTLEYSYGFDRLEVLAAFTNAVFLVFVSLFLVAEAVHRFSEPVNIHTDHIFAVAMVGFMVNVTGYIILTRMYNKSVSSNLRGRIKHDTGKVVAREANIQSIILHTKGDIISSIGVIVSTTLVHWKGWVAADPLVSLAIASYVVYSVLPLLSAMGSILLQTMPSQHKVEINKCIRDISALDGVIECLQERYWTHAPGVNVATLRIKIKPDADRHKVVTGAYGILSPIMTHITLQVERVQPIGWWKDG